MSSGPTYDPGRLREFCDSHQVRDLSIFGSAARGDAGPYSDVDVLVDIAPGARIGLVEFQRMREELEALFGRPVDLVSRSGLNPHIREQVLKEARVLHAQ